MSNQKNNGNWLIDYFSLTAAFVAYIVMYLFASLINNSLSPLDWGPISISLTTLLTLFLLLSLLNYQQSQGKLNLDLIIKSTIDLQQYKGLSPIDVFLSHYTNVATIGLFIATLMYSARPIAPSNQTFIAIIVAIVLFVIFFLYALLFAKLAFRLSILKSKPIYVIMAMTIFIIDSQAIKLFIASVPK